MLIAQISDWHVRVPEARLFGAVDSYGALARAVAAVLALDPLPDAVIHTGDLSHDGDEEDYAALAELLSRLPMPVYAVPGNHDRRELARRHLAFTGTMPQNGPIRHCVDQGPLRLIGLDSLVEGETGGHLGSEQLAWLDECLSSAPQRPALVFLHHPPFATGIAFMDGIMLKDHAQLAEIIGRHSQVALVTCGHVHRMVLTRFAGTAAAIAPGVAHHVPLDIRPNAPSRWNLEPPAMLLHRWTPEWGLVTHLAHTGDHGAEAPLTNHHPRLAV